VVQFICTYLREINFPQTVVVGIRIAQIGRTSVSYELCLLTGSAIRPTLRHKHSGRTSTSTAKAGGALRSESPWKCWRLLTFGNEDAGMPKEQSPGKPTTRRTPWGRMAAGALASSAELELELTCSPFSAKFVVCGGRGAYGLVDRGRVVRESLRYHPVGNGHPHLLSSPICAPLSPTRRTTCGRH
jgi:hypothetical protein